ncbi:transcriptional regulator in cluster with unspecified monosaccharide ABC transport system [Halalkalibacter akibai JCM 9157]|uniref:Transcriptional regulator in cluster with unspecified monosaccharide ABC transport system n=1 Tax=Halalkalibacter akibai (strain ATCC 43226 / DSM 21942 / CIP 109018 / JCM 9157 / 1139) TaxID=1236973 RepID=W4QRE8_HALA3|nr:transcriptional regulator in cluster with unspecified monosaccharide ABC transport system [Halalkalibacter akibai JCM 9157]
MSELGQHLKEIREQKGISLDDLQQTTKIQKRYLIAIEEGRFDTLPGIFYARAFVKTYAEAIGLDPDPLFDQYKNELPNPQREAVTLPSRSERTKTVTPPKKRNKKSSFLPALAAIIFITAVVVGIWIMAQGSGAREDGAIAPDDSENLDAEFADEVGIPEEPESEEETGTEETEELDEVEEEEVEPEPEPSFTLTFIESSGNTSYFEMKDGQLSDVLIELNGSSYIDVKNALGRVFYSGQPPTGEKVTLDLSAEERIVFNFGASQNVDFFINGEEFEFPLDRTHQKVDIIIIDEAEE